MDCVSTRSMISPWLPKIAERGMSNLHDLKHHGRSKLKFTNIILLCGDCNTIGDQAATRLAQDLSFTAQRICLNTCKHCESLADRRNFVPNCG